MRIFIYIFYEKISIIEISSLNKNLYSIRKYENISLLKIFINSNINRQKIFNLSEKQTNIAINYINEWKKLNKTRNDWIEYNGETCNTTVPSVDELYYNNIYWQTVSNEKSIGYYLYNAYYDNRGDNKTIRIIASRVNSVRIEKLRYSFIFFSNFMNRIQGHFLTYDDLNQRLTFLFH